MLQQTQVATVIPYFQRFLSRFPDIGALAAADEQEVLKLWEGLGYYRRARDLHRAARLIVAKYAGRFPEEPDIVRQLPGFGRYTANAVLSQAFDKSLPIVEANSRRVLCRLLAVRADPASSDVQKLLWSAAGALVPLKKAGTFNQALMELGALVCKPRQPLCHMCPLRAFCQACVTGRQNEIPVPKTKTPVTEVNEVCLVIRQGEKVLLAQRPATGRWAGLWEFPHAALNANETLGDAVERLPADLGIRTAGTEPILTLRHGITRFRITLACFEAKYISGMFGSKLYERAEWLGVEKLSDYPVSAPQRRLANWLASAP